MTLDIARVATRQREWDGSTGHEIGKTDNGIVLLSTYLYDGVRRLPLDVALYQHASSLPQDKEDPRFVKKPDLALKLIDQCLQRKYRPRVTVVDAGYGNNTSFIKQLESRKLKYIAAIAKNRQVTYQLSGEEQPCRHSVTEIAQVLDSEHFTPVELELDQPRTVWIATLQVQVPKLEARVGLPFNLTLRLGRKPLTLITS
jgi:hypothetical protein